MNNDWAMLAAWKIVKNLRSRRLRVAIGTRRPAQVRRVVLLPPGLVKDPRCLASWVRCKLPSRHPQLQLVAIIVGGVVAPVREVAVKVANVYCRVW